MKSTSLRKNIIVALLSAIAFLIMFLQFPLPLFPAFLTIDLSDIPAIIGAIIYGPIAGIVIEAIKNILHWLTTGSVTGVPVGEFANFLTGTVYIVVSIWMFRKRKTLRSLIIGMVAGTIATAIVMCIANYFVIYPSYAYFLGFPVDAAIKMAQAANHSIHDLFSLVVLAVLPFNLLKCIVISVIAIPIYVRLRPRIGFNL
ncbi:MAG: ECF transporter S component [Tuberibacillus sp.]